jgi:hypothetical protein
MLDQRIEAGVLGDDVEERARVLAGERANVVGDVEVQGFAPGVSRITYSALLPSDWRAAASDTGTLDCWGPKNTLTLKGPSLSRSKSLGWTFS